MKIKEFVESNKKVNTTTSLNKSLVKTKYLPFRQKQELVERVVDQCVMYKDGMLYFDEFQKYIVFTTAIIQEYTGLEFNVSFEEVINEYDMLCEAELLNKVIKLFEGEYNTVLNMLNVKTEDVLRQNTIEHQVAKFLSSVSEKLEELTPMLANSINSLNFAELGISDEDIQSLKKFMHST